MSLVGVRSVVLEPRWTLGRIREVHAAGGSLLREVRNCSTIRWLVYSRVVFQVLVLRMTGINSIRAVLLFDMP